MLRGIFVDNALMRFVDIVLTLPILFIILMIVGFFGQGNRAVVIIAIGITGWTLAARLIRGEFLMLREMDFVHAAKALGAGHRRIIGRHLLPSFASHLIASATLSIPNMILGETALSFLGIGGGFVRYDSQVKYGVVAQGGAEPGEDRQDIGATGAGLELVEECVVGFGADAEGEH